MRTRHDVAGLTLGDPAAAETEPWHPVLDTYARGVALMQELDADVSPDSWLWAANTHGIDQFTDPRPAWDQCAHGSRFFLPWHRAYLAWFEGTIRRLTGEDDWGLPYWDYSDPALEATRVLPAEFAVETRTVDGEVVANPLFVPDRSPDPLPEADVDLVRTMSETRFVRQVPSVGFGGADRDGFFGDVENQPHNFVHMDIGGIMQSPATAAGDPIFWLHHANIDRLWEVWRGLPGLGRADRPGRGVRSCSSPSGGRRSSRSATSGRPTTYTTADIEDLASPAMGYGYESTVLPEAVADEVDGGPRCRPDAGGGMALDDTEPSWEPVGATFDVTSGEDREVAFTAGRRGLTTPCRRGWCSSSAAPARRTRTRRTSWRCGPRPDAEPHVAGRFSTFGLAGTPDTEERNYLVDATDVLPGPGGRGLGRRGAQRRASCPESGRPTPVTRTGRSRSARSPSTCPTP